MYGLRCANALHPVPSGARTCYGGQMSVKRIEAAAHRDASKTASGRLKAIALGIDLPPSEVQDAESNVRTAAQIGHPDSVLAWTGSVSAVGPIVLTLLIAVRERPHKPVSSSRLLARRTGRETGLTVCDAIRATQSTSRAPLRPLRRRGPRPFRPSRCVPRGSSAGGHVPGRQPRHDPCTNCKA